MNMIVTLDSNFGISYKGRPLVSIPADKKLKLQETSGKVIVYGEKYINELPGQQPVRESMNIVFTDSVKTGVKTAKNVVLCDTIDAVREELKKYKSEDIYIIDNEKLYREFLPDTNVIHVTKIDYVYSADAFFENLDRNEDFTVTADSEEQYCFDIVYNFMKYERRQK